MYIKPEPQDELEVDIVNTPSDQSSSDDTFSPPAANHPHHQHFYHHHTPTTPNNYLHPSSNSSRMKRLRANDRERRRVHLINCAMEELKEHVPGLKDKRKLTKLELLRAANHYIWILDEALRTNHSIDQIQKRAEQPVSYALPPVHTFSPPLYYVRYGGMPKLRRESSS
uniref:Neurogenin n=1 Tax=Clytia hemisphaerica TaxID=252671 RepID=A0A0P0ENJ6_9CNID|nr:neurogenin [Clytia hemisphaerica]